MMSTQRSTLRATSQMDSRSPSGELVWSTKMALPPMVLMPASKLMRVRRLAFSNISTICFASRACRYSRGFRFTSWPSLRIARTSPLERSETEHISSPASRAAAARISGSFSTGIAGSRCSMVALLATGMSSCGLSCGLRCVLSEDFVQRGNGMIDMFALENERWKEAKYGIACAIDQDVALQHFGYGQLGEIGRSEIGCAHEAFATNLLDGVMS